MGAIKVSISQEFVISLFVQLLILAFFVGIYVATIRFMGKQIEDLKTSLQRNKDELNKKLDDDRKELKDEMAKYNNVLERMIITEQSTKSAHKRIDFLEGK